MNEPTNKQTNQPTDKQTNKQTSKDYDLVEIELVCVPVCS